jgi:hypothetical protein
VDFSLFTFPLSLSRALLALLQSVFISPLKFFFFFFLFLASFPSQLLGLQASAHTLFISHAITWRLASRRILPQSSTDLQLICKLQEKNFTERVLINCRASFPVAMPVQSAVL